MDVEWRGQLAEKISVLGNQTVRVGERDLAFDLELALAGHFQTSTVLDSGLEERMIPSTSRNSVTRPWTTAVNSTPGRLALDRYARVSSTIEGGPGDDTLRGSDGDCHIRCC